MRAFNIETADGALKVVIFAKTEQIAADMFCDHHLARYGRMPAEFMVERRTIRADSDATALQIALRLRQSGLGTLLNGSWSIKDIPRLNPDAV